MLFKEPTDISPYTVDWSDWLDDLTISNSTWSVPSGVTKDDDDNADTSTRIILSGGTWGETYELTNTITTSNGLVETRALLVRIQRLVSYCSSTDVRRRASSGPASGSSSATLTALPSVELEALIEQGSRMFDQICGVPAGYFNPVAIPIAQTRTIFGNGTNYLRLPPYIPGSLNTTITLPEGYTVPTFTEQNDGRTFYLILNSAGVLPPFERFCNHRWSGWYSGVAVTVSAIWGFRETPADVKMAVIELILNLWRETDPNNLRLINLDNQPLRERMPPRVAEVARYYRGRMGAFV